ncbi:hypothetical protein V5E97_09215 [Singulisphaera sp. Ch08]|uniref:Tetratricopeptide repeat protein n=1 Tax=Singulisphaera sp. Ch08 TaxID=3120278 RepID=A0AAU7CNM8_9BACT
MHRIMGILVVLLCPVLLIGGEPTPVAKAANLIPDPDYLPKVGDRAVLYSLDSEKIPFDLWCATTSENCRNFIKSMFATDDQGEEANDPSIEAKIVHLTPKTDVQLLSVETVEVEGGKDGAPLKCTYFAIRVLSGPFQGQTLYTLDFHITRLVAPPVPHGAADGDKAAKSIAPGSAPTQVLFDTANVPATEQEAAKLPEPPAPAPAAAPALIELETPDVLAAKQEAAKRPEPPAPAPARIELETPDDLTSKREAAKRPEPPVPVPARIELEIPDDLTSKQEAAKLPEPPAPAPARIELETPDVPTKPIQETAGISAVAPSTLPEASSLPEPVGLESAAPAQDVSSSSAPSPKSHVDILTAETSRRVIPGVEPPALADSSPSSRPASLAQPTLASASPEPPAAPAQLSLPLTPLPEPDIASRAIVRESSAGRPPAVSSPRAQTTGISSQIDRRMLSNPARGVVSAPAKPLSAPEMLTGARARDTAGKTVEALVAYRTLERTHPGSRESRIAIERIKGLTEKLQVDAQEVRAASVMKQAREIEAAGKRTLALSYFQQIVKVYPKTPTARLASEHIKSMGTSSPSPGN